MSKATSLAHATGVTRTIDLLGTAAVVLPVFHADTGMRMREENDAVVA
jgi:hypothetical protein